MAVTYAVSNLQRNVEGSKRSHRGRLTATGTYTAGGDAITPAQLGLSTIEHLVLNTYSDAQANPSSLTAIPVRVSDLSWKIALASNVVGAVNTATIAAGKSLPLTAGETVTGYIVDFEAIGR
jgi:hypothetical protein